MGNVTRNGDGVLGHRGSVEGAWQMFANSGATNSTHTTQCDAMRTVKLFGHFFSSFTSFTLMGFVQLPVPVPVRFGLVWFGFAFSPLRIFYCAKNDFLFSIFWFDFGGGRGGEREHR